MECKNKIMLVDVNSPEFEKAMMGIFQKAIKKFQEETENDPFKDLPEMLSRNQVAGVLGQGRGYGWLCNNAVKEAELATLGRKIDFYKEVVERRDRSGKPYFRKKEIRQYYNVMVNGDATP